MSNELDNLLKLAGIVNEAPVVDDLRKKKADSGTAKKDFVLDQDAERILRTLDKNDAFDEYDSDDMMSDIPDLSNFSAMYDSINPVHNPEDEEGEFSFDMGDDRIIDVGDENDFSHTDDREYVRSLFNDAPVDEVISCDDGAGEWVKDFQKSDDAKFSGDSKEQRKKRALGAFYKKCEDASMDEGGHFVGDPDEKYNTELDSLLGPEEDRISPEDVADEYDDTQHCPFGDDYDDTQHCPFGDDYEHEHGQGDEDEGFPYPDDDASFFQPEFDETKKVVEYEDDIGEVDPDEEFFKNYAKKQRVQNKKPVIDIGDEDDSTDSSFDKTEIPMFDDASGEPHDRVALVDKVMTSLEGVLDRGDFAEQHKVEEFLKSLGVNANTFEELPGYLEKLDPRDLQAIHDTVGPNDVEETDMHNGYDNVKNYDAGTPFPDGSTGPSAQEVGPTSAKNGDNPMYAKMKESIKKELTESYKAYKK